MVRKVMRLPAVLEAVGYKKSQWYLLISQGKAPRGHKPHAKATFWWEDDIAAFQAGKWQPTPETEVAA